MLVTVVRVVLIQRGTVLRISSDDFVGILFGGLIEEGNFWGIQNNLKFVGGARYPGRKRTTIIY